MRKSLACWFKSIFNRQDLQICTNFHYFFAIRYSTCSFKIGHNIIWIFPPFQQTAVTRKSTKTHLTNLICWPLSAWTGSLLSLIQKRTIRRAPTIGPEIRRIPDAGSRHAPKPCQSWCHTEGLTNGGPAPDSRRWTRDSLCHESRSARSPL